MDSQVKVMYYVWIPWWDYKVEIKEILIIKETKGQYIVNESYQKRINKSRFDSDGTMRQDSNFYGLDRNALIDRVIKEQDRCIERMKKEIKEKEYLKEVMEGLR